MPFNDILQTTRSSDDDLCTLAEVELLLFDRTLGHRMSNWENGQ